MTLKAFVRKPRPSFYALVQKIKYSRKYIIDRQFLTYMTWRTKSPRDILVQKMQPLPWEDSSREDLCIILPRRRASNFAYPRCYTLSTTEFLFALQHVNKKKQKRGESRTRGPTLVLIIFEGSTTIINRSPERSCVGCLHIKPKNLSCYKPSDTVNTQKSPCWLLFVVRLNSVVTDCQPE